MREWICKRSRWLIFLSFLLLSFLSLYIVYFQNGHILIGDDYHFHQNRIEGLAQSLAHGIWLPKISYFFIGGYGYASSLFYPDFYLYIPALLRVAGFSLATSFLFFATMINLGTFGITYLSGRIMGLPKLKSYLFSLLYTLSIYRLQDFFNRQAIGELLAMGFFPLVLASLSLLKAGKVQNWWLLTIAMTGIGLAHFISLEIVSIFIGLYVLLNARRFVKKQTLTALLKATIVTILLLAFYLVPVFEQMSRITFQVTANPLTLISDRSYALGELLANSFENRVFHASSANIGLILLVGLLVNGVMLFKQKNVDRDLLFLSFLFMFMTTNLFPWQLFDQTPLNTIQFPWRFLSIVTLLSAYLIANDYNKILKKIPYGQGILILFILLGVVIYEWESIDTEGKRIVSHQSYDQTNSYYIGAGHEYLPKEVNYQKLLKNKKREISYDPEVMTIKKSELSFASVSFDYQVALSKPAIVTLPFIYYYGYQAKVIEDGKVKEIPAVLNKQNGYVALSLSGKGKVTVSYKTTWAQKISLSISLITLAPLFSVKVVPYISKKF
ncbi:hypothetical protein JZO66_07825 [Enterococcus sp. DIV0242_7C1]|uniref:Uncharacterized protein n=1 Tax=Candidatus Enterococcus dunnyi TaxID=1834192 RepID=A0A200J0V8_9ENTE|nr:MULTISPECIES: 6-pyruvoyl-tetrahydropterin synthase-related protein [unclassified Enterococcus]MBO0470451.1 hypothetical protein [Enterococcus sp. DIV0242_7C1]OUZ30185.1 hypothetical protein A5889_002473 [Enterococcus sp. 9D6_DIV0238]